MQRFLRSLPGALAVVVILSVCVSVAAVGFRVHHVTHPPREVSAVPDLGSMVSRFEEVHFRSTDGLTLGAWLVRGRPGMPAILLCHDLGETKASLMNLAIQLQGAGFTLLAFDFRGHGESEGNGSTLGAAEKRDVIGAIDYLRSVKEVDGRKVGVYGVGLGAHAAVLAAADRHALKVLVLDGLYPDVSYPLVRKTYADWPFGIRYLAFLPEAVFRAFAHEEIDRAANVLPRLREKDVLFVAPAGDSALAVEMQKMYASMTERPGAETNLITLPVTRIGKLYGDDAERYYRKVLEFFETRLASS